MAEPLRNPDLYDADFYAWTQNQAAKLRARAHNAIDWENAAEEIESLGRIEKREMENRLAVVLLHLLKWRFQPAHRSSSWRGSMRERRLGLSRLIDESPSLRNYPATVVDYAYESSVLKAGVETGLAETVFPAACPFTIEEILDPDFHPEAE